MIIPNGTIEFIYTSGGGLDDEGRPVVPYEGYGGPIPCQYVANSHNYHARSEGEPYVRASYSILIEYLIPFTGTERVRLRDRFGCVVREFPVLQFEPLDAVCQTRIVV